MRAIQLSLCVVLLFVSSVWASDEGAIVAQSIDTYEQIEAIRSEMRDAVGDLADEKRAYELADYELDDEPKTQDQLDELTGSIKQQAKSLERMQAGNGSKESIAYSQRRIRDLTLILEASKLQTDAERDAHRQELQPIIEKLAADIQSIELPFQTSMREITGPADAGNEALAGVIRPYIKTPESTYPGSTIEHFNATVHMAFGSSHWNDSDGKQIAWAHIRIRSLDEIEDYHREKLLDGKYPIQSLSDGSIWVWAGNFLITFVADDDELKGQENIQEMVKQFVDLQGLAAIKVQAGSVATGALAE
jgi:hypothetical protein